MLGLMQDTPLTVNWILDRADQYFRDKSVTTRTVTEIRQQTLGEVIDEARLVAAALDSLGISPDGRVATFAWNTAHHLALYGAIPATGRIMHTANIRYFPEQLIYSINHAEDEAIFVDRSLLGLLSPHLPKLTSLRHVVVMDDGAPAELPDDPRVIDFAELLSGLAPAELSGRVADERTAAALCYTTGTTGNPKGVLYTHRSTWLHSFGLMTTAVWAIGERDNVMPVVPMFHANAWGIPYGALLAGSSLTLPGPDLSPTALLDLLAGERVTATAGVPTIWMGLAPLLRDYDLSALRIIVCGGSAVPRSLSETYRETIGLPITQAWGMTETSPLGSVANIRSEVADLDLEALADVRATAGLAAPGVELRITDTDTGERVPWDGETSGELEARGPWVARQYYRTDEPGPQYTADGWLRTGDVAAIDPLGYVRIVDRTKDLVKSGGEWISSVDLENQIMGHPRVAEAAVIAIAHPKWGERPLACVVVKSGEELTTAELRDFLATRVGKWQIPDDVVFIDEVPKTSVGKFSKKTLRERFSDYHFPNS